MKLHAFYRSPDEGGSGGGTPEPTLEELGSGTTDNSVVLTAEEIAAKAAKQDGLGGVPKPADLTDPAPAADPATPTPAPGGKPEDPGEAAQRLPGTPDPVTDPPADPATEDDKTDPADEDDFFTVVDKIHGVDIRKEITYPEGIDPASPEGVVIREQYFEKRGGEIFEQYLKETDPRGYAYLLHRQSGGDDKSFFDKPGIVLPDLEALKDSVDLQRTIYTQSLLAKGNSEKQAKALVEMAIKDGDLQTEAEAAHKEIDKREKKALEDAQNKVTKEKQAQQAQLTAFDTLLTTEITKGENLKFVIPEADKPKFAAAIKDNLMYEDGKFFIVKEVTKENLGKTIQTELFGYLDGDLKKLIERQAKSVTAKRLTLKAAVKDTPTNVHTAQGGQTLGEL
jgi:hypothetical protein